MVRVVKQDDEMVVDRKQVLPGRGAYVHARCAEAAVKRGGLARALRCAVPGSFADSLIRNAKAQK